MRKGVSAAAALCLLVFFCPPVASPEMFDLESVIIFALKHNPSLRIAEKNVAIERSGVESAKAERMPKVDFGSGATRYRYPLPLTPIFLPSTLSFSTLANLQIPDFERTIYDAGASFRLPLYRGGRIAGNIRIAETREALAKENYRASQQDLVFNLTSVFHKILQLQRLLAANEASVKQLEDHRRNAELFLKAGTAPRLDVLKAEVDLAHGRDNLLLVRNNLESALELLKDLMGIEEAGAAITITAPPASEAALQSREEDIRTALSRRPDYLAISKKKAIQEDRIRVAWGKWLPDIYGSGQYIKKGGDGTSFPEDWFLGLRLTIPVFDGGLIRQEVDREKAELEKVRQEERAMRLSIFREVKDAHLGIANASDRIGVAEKAIESARETARVERLKYETGAATGTDVIDSQAALLRSEADYYQALYDREIAFAARRKATGESEWAKEVLR